MKFKVGDRVKDKIFRVKGTVVSTKHNDTTSSGIKYRDIKIEIDEEDTFLYSEKLIQGKYSYREEDELELITPKPFSKADLKDGMICTFRSGSIAHVVGNWLVEPSKNNISSFNMDCHYKDDLTFKGAALNSWDIMQVIRNGEVVFERKEISYHQQLMKFEDCFREYRLRLRYNKEYRNEELAKQALEEAIKLCKEIEVK